jgi:predicted metal-dependent hydrolase
MTKQKKHTIGLLQYELVANSKKKATDIQNEISKFSKNELPNFLGPAFNKFDKKGISLVIDRLEIDMGNISHDDFKLKFREIIRNELSQKLKEIFSQPIKDYNKSQVAVKEETDYHIIESFLISGNLPWYADGSKIDLRRMTKNLLRRKDRLFADLIRQHIWDKNFQSRLENIISETSYKDLFSMFTTENIWKTDSIFKQYLSLYRTYPFSNKALKSFRLLLFESLIEELSTESSTGNLHIEISVFNKLARKLNIKSTLLIENSRKSLQMVQNKPYSNAQIGLFLHQVEAWLQTNNAEISARDPEQVEKISEVENTSYLIFNSGLVLLNPYLNELFKKLELINNNTFINEQAQIKAIHLLQYALTGKSGHQEHLLLLNKILCGFPTGKYIPWFAELNMREKSETTRMITATIRNWGTMNNTSASTFRTDFLQRKGILKKFDNKWKLSVERNASDVLMDRLPWQYELIKFKWMESTIETSW